MPRQPNTSPQTKALLGALLEQPDTWQHGYDLSKRTNLKSGTLYPILARLEQGGMLSSTWIEPSSPGKPARHAYKLTPNGMAFVKTLESKQAKLKQLKTSTT